MKPTQKPSLLPTGTAVSCDLVAYSSVRATEAQLPTLRQRPGPGAGESLPGTILRHADEQTVVGLAAVLQAIHHAQLQQTSFSDWGVVAAPCFLGRVTLANALQRYAAEGAWGISPHFIPHRSGHAVSGTISQVLKIHGPNLGAGGGPGGAVDAFLAASVLVEGHGLPGVWVVLSAMDSEAIPAPDGTAPKGLSCLAVALALAAARPGWTGPQLRIVPGVVEEKCLHPALPATRMLGSLESLVGGLTGNKLLPTTLVWRLDDGGWLELRTGGLPRVQIPQMLHRLNGHRLVDGPRPGAGTEKKW